MESLCGFARIFIYHENIHTARVVQLSAKELCTMSKNNSFAGALHRIKFILSCREESTVFSLTLPLHDLQTVAKMKNETLAEILRQKIWDNQTHSNASYYRGNFHFEEDYGTSHLSVLSPDGDAVALTSTINFQ